MEEKILRLKKLRKERDKIEQEEKELTEPILDNMSKIGIVYNIFQEQIKGIDNPPKEGSVTYRQMFIYVVLMIYAPGVLIGDKMPKGLRSIISKTLNVKCDSGISNNSTNVIFMYNNYRWFRDSVNYLYAEILFRLNFGNIK